MSEDKSKVSIFVVNKHFKKEIRSLVKFGDFIPSEKVVISEITSNSPFDKNNFRNKERIKINKKGKRVNRNEFTYLFPPHSITNLIFSLKEKQK